MNISANIRVILIVFFLFLYIFNPYTIIGPLAYFMLPLVTLPFFHRFKYLPRRLLYGGVLLSAISLIGVISSIFHDIFQINHLKVSMSIAIYILLTSSLFYSAYKNSITYDDIVYYVLLAILINSLIVLLEVVVPTFRDLVETILIPIGNVDWTEGFRYRGFASGGGASLSLVAPVGVAISLHLYTSKYISIFSFNLYVAVIVVSALFIGRTGLVLLPIVFLLFMAFNFQKYFLKMVLMIVVLACLFLLVDDLIYNLVVNKYGTGFFEYSIGFALKGVDGFKEEGTVSILLDFLTVVPTKLPEIFTGYGFYGGSEFVPWTDSGYSRMFLSVGYLFGLLYYMIFLVMFFSPRTPRRFLHGSVLILLIVAEVKEPLLMSGYASRVYILLAVLSLMFSRYSQVNPPHNSKG